MDNPVENECGFQEADVYKGDKPKFPHDLSKGPSIGKTAIAFGAIEVLATACNTVNPTPEITLEALRNHQAIVDIDSEMKNNWEHQTITNEGAPNRIISDEFMVFSQQIDGQAKPVVFGDMDNGFLSIARGSSKDTSNKQYTELFFFYWNPTTKKFHSWRMDESSLVQNLTTKTATVNLVGPKGERNATFGMDLDFTKIEASKSLGTVSILNAENNSWSQISLDLSADAQNDPTIFQKVFEAFLNFGVTPVQADYNTPTSPAPTEVVSTPTSEQTQTVTQQPTAEQTQTVEPTQTSEPTSTPDRYKAFRYQVGTKLYIDPNKHREVNRNIFKDHLREYGVNLTGDIPNTIDQKKLEVMLDVIAQARAEQDPNNLIPAFDEYGYPNNTLVAVRFKSNSKEGVQYIAYGYVEDADHNTTPIFFFPTTKGCLVLVLDLKMNPKGSVNPADTDLYELLNLKFDELTTIYSSFSKFETDMPAFYPTWEYIYAKLAQDYFDQLKAQDPNITGDPLELYKDYIKNRLDSGKYNSSPPIILLCP